jgi:hypothetical protein
MLDTDAETIDTVFASEDEDMRLPGTPAAALAIPVTHFRGAVDADTGRPLARNAQSDDDDALQEDIRNYRRNVVAKSNRATVCDHAAHEWMRQSINDNDDDDVRAQRENHLAGLERRFDSIRRHYAAVDAQFDAMRVEVLHEDPPLIAIHNFFSASEVAELIALGQTFQLNLSFINQNGIVNGRVPPLSTISETRSSKSMYYRMRMPWMTARARALVDTIALRSRAVTGMPCEHIDPQFLQYEPGGEFQEHHDGLARVYTLFGYLNTLAPNAGGATVFPHIGGAALPGGVSSQPQAGTVVAWQNYIDLDRSVEDDRMRHAGEPVLKGAKFGVNIFVNSRRKTAKSGRQSITIEK